jgi:hypothetical protein
MPSSGRMLAIPVSADVFQENHPNCTVANSYGLAYACSDIRTHGGVLAMTESRLRTEENQNHCEAPKYHTNDSYPHDQYVCGRNRTRPTEMITTRSTLKSSTHTACDWSRDLNIPPCD